MTIIEQIKAEIERRLKNTRDYMNGAGMKYKGPKYHASRGRESAYDAILSFLYTLESEKPMNQDELEKEIENAWEKLEKDYSPAALDKTTILVSGLVSEKQFSKITRHFAQWGAEHLKH